MSTAFAMYSRGASCRRRELLPTTVHVDDGDRAATTAGVEPRENLRPIVVVEPRRSALTVPARQTVEHVVGSEPCTRDRHGEPEIPVVVLRFRENVEVHRGDLRTPLGTRAR